MKNVSEFIHWKNEKKGYGICQQFISKSTVKLKFAEDDQMLQWERKPNTYVELQFDFK